MPEARQERLLKQLRGNDYRLAFKAIAELRRVDDGSLSDTIARYKPKDTQREFQLRVARIVIEGGVGSLAKEWSELPWPEWREKLIGEIGQFLALWADEGTIDLLIAALNDPADHVARRAVSPLLECLKDLSAKERRELTRTDSGQAFLAAKEKLQHAVTPARRARIAQAVLRALTRHSDDPRGLTWPNWYIELLGHTATRSDKMAIEMLETLRPRAGDPYRVEYEQLDSSNMQWYERLLAERKGVTPVVRISHIPTGLLDLALLETALNRIRAREQ